MWWIALAFAGSPLPTVLPDALACADPAVPDAATLHAAAHLAAIGVPVTATRVRIYHGAPNCCPPLTVGVLDALDRPLGHLELADDCSVHRVEIAGNGRHIPLFSLPVGPTPATAIVAAWPALAQRATAEDWVVGWATRRGFRVALVRVWPAVTVAVAEARLDPEGEMDRPPTSGGAIRWRRGPIRAFTVPEGAMARTGASFGRVAD